VFVHGAFRGGWYWGPLLHEMRVRDQRGHSYSLPGCGEHSVPPRSERLTLSDWADSVARYLVVNDLSDVVLVGHSLGAVVVTEANSLSYPDVVDRVSAVVLLDGPVLHPGERPTDLSNRSLSTIPPRSAWIEPMAPDPTSWNDSSLYEWMTAQLTAMPIGPGLDPISQFPYQRPTHIVFCSDTPTGYPSSLSRARCDIDGTPYWLIEGGHDAPVTHPNAVVDVLELIRQSSTV
jgi:pimeloyl-ACP methyl ester carboxylesterase